MQMQNIVTNGNGHKTDIGVWFITYNNPKMWSNNFGTGNPIEYRALISERPDTFGIQDSADPAGIDFQLSKLAQLGIDFILYDITNGGLTGEIPYGWGETEDTGNRWIVKNARLTCERIATWNKEHEHKIRYAFAVGCYRAIRGYKYDKDGNQLKEGMSIGVCTELQAEPVYKQFFQDPVIGGDNYYQLNGKPLLVIHDWGENVVTVPHGWNAYTGDRTYGDKFTVRNGQKGQAGTYGWQTTYGTQPHPEVEVVCPGWASAHTGGGIISRECGAYYRRGWNVVLSNPAPRIVMIASWNDYNESCAIFPADTSNCTCTQEEQWRDTDGKLDPFLFWNITKESIERLRIKSGDDSRQGKE